MQTYIYVDEALDCLQSSDNLTLLTATLQNELSFFCDRIGSDESYVFADLILDRRNKSSWAICSKQVSKNEIRFVLPLQTPSKQLKRSVYDILSSNDLIHHSRIKTIEVVN